MRTESTIENVARARERIAAALERSGRSGEDVTIVGVTKTFGPERVEELVRAGITDVGENRVQEFLDKKSRVSLPCRWHLVGTLQRNKAAKVIGEVHLIHSLDGLKLAETLSRLAADRGITVRALVQVNTSGEETKHGLKPEELIDTLARIVRLPNLLVNGLMTIGPLTDDPAERRRSFFSLRNLRGRAEDELGIELPELSMGMSDDFEEAVEEGATIVRLGRVLLGDRG
jgi:hypothetical protein